MNLQLFLSGRGNFVKKLTINNLILTDDSKIPLTDKTSPTFDSVINESLKSLTEIVGLNLKNNQYLTTISLVSNMESLTQIDLRGTNVTDLLPLADNCLSLRSIVTDNPNIIVANDVDKSTGKAEITAVEKLFNNTYNKKGGIREYELFPDSCGVILANINLINQLSKSTNIVNFQSGYYDFGSIFGDSEVSFDLRNTKLKNFWYRYNGSSSGDEFKFPSTLINVDFENCYTRDGELCYRFDSENLETLSLVKYVIGRNCDWDTYMSFVSKLPKLETIDFYCSVVSRSWSLQNYCEDLKKIEPLKNLKIYGYIGSMESSDIGYDQLYYISEFTSLETVSLRYMKKLTDVSFLKDLTNLKSVDLSYTGVHSLSFIKKLNNLIELVIDNTTVGETDFDENNQVINNLDLIKEAFNKNLRTINISNTSITSEEIEFSGLRDLGWKSFIY